MTQYAIKPGWTAARQRRLESIVLDPEAPRESGPAGFHCMHFGWTEWVQNKEDHVFTGERLTAEGERILAEWQARI